QREGTGVAVHLAPDAPLSDDLARLLASGRRVGADRSAHLRKLLATLPEHTPDPTLTVHLRSDDPAALLDDLLTYDAVDYAWITRPPAQPPVDLDPPTPDLEPQQTWWSSSPEGVGMRAARAWPGGDGVGIVIADVELSFAPDHEDLLTQPPIVHSGQAYELEDWSFHGTGVLGICCAASDGYGTTGGASGAEAWVVHPVYDRNDDYRPADAIISATLDLVPGDILLLELQTYGTDGLLPITAEPDVWDAVSVATAAGIVVVVPASNGGLDLDDPDLDGWFDRALHDNGAILVGAVDPADGSRSRSCYGSAVDVHGWGKAIVAPTDGDHQPDLFFPDGDDRQAYTSRFGGTSGAAAQVAAASAVAQGVSLHLHGEPVDPRTLRSWFRASGNLQDTHARAEQPIGSYLDVRRLIQAWLSP
ncbi:MAG: hypothetical protein ACI9MC_000478, partial [Kiritimatiellia bacterium]